MTPSRTATIVVLVLVFTTLTTALGIYAYRQSCLTLEGNSLYSPSAIALDAGPKSTVQTLVTRGASGRVFISLPGDDRIRAVSTIGTPGDPLPLHSGRQPGDHDDRVALVGSSIGIHREQGAAYYIHDGQRYEVIGRLGLEESSLVADQVLLIDKSFFRSSVTTSLVVDSAAGRSLFQAKLGDGSAISLGADTNRRTNIDYVSPILINYGAGLALRCFALTGALAGRGYRPRYELARLVGTVPGLALCRGLASFTAVVIPLITVGIAVRVASTPIQVDWRDVGAGAGAQVFLALAGFATGVLARRQEAQA